MTILRKDYLIREGKIRVVLDLDITIYKRDGLRHVEGLDKNEVDVVVNVYFVKVVTKNVSHEDGGIVLNGIIRIDIQGRTDIVGEISSKVTVLNCEKTHIETTYF